MTTQIPSQTPSLSPETTTGGVVTKPVVIPADKEYHRNWYQKNKERISIEGKTYRAENKEKISERTKLYRQNHKEMFKIKDHNRFLRDKDKRLILTRKIYLRNKYGILPDQYEEMFKEQKGKCAICNKVSKRKLAIDHDHDTGLIRELLCSNCNRALGYFKDSKENLKKAVSYLERWSK